MTPPYIIRALEIADLPAVIQLWEQTAGLGQIDSQAMLATYLERNQGISSGAFCASTNQPLGAVLCGHDGRRGYLYHLAVAPESREQGLAKQLVERSLAELVAAGIFRCTAFIYLENDAAWEFWQHLQWSERTDLRVVSQVSEKNEQ